MITLTGNINVRDTTKDKAFPCNENMLKKLRKEGNWVGNTFTLNGTTFVLEHDRYEEILEYIDFEIS